MEPSGAHPAAQVGRSEAGSSLHSSDIPLCCDVSPFTHYSRTDSLHKENNPMTPLSMARCH